MGCLDRLGCPRINDPSHAILCILSNGPEHNDLARAWLQDSKKRMRKHVVRLMGELQALELMMLAKTYATTSSDMIIESVFMPEG